MNEKKYGISSSVLKCIAMLTMLIDHIGAGILKMSDVLYFKYQYIYDILRMIGRVAFPIFCFLIVEGFLHTKNIKKYASRLFLFAFISEIPFDLAFNSMYIEFSHQNVMFTLGLSVIMLYFLDLYKDKRWKRFFVLAIFALLAELIRCDYGAFGVILIAVMYSLHNDRIKQAIICSIMLLWEFAAIFAFIPIKLYNGRQGRNIKYFAYIFYPLHLILIYLIREFIIL